MVQRPPSRQSGIQRIAGVAPVFRARPMATIATLSWPIVGGEYGKRTKSGPSVVAGESVPTGVWVTGPVGAVVISGVFVPELEGCSEGGGPGLSVPGAGVSAEGAGVSAEGAGVSAEGAGVSAEGAGVSAEGAGVSAEGAGVSAEGAGVSAEGAPESAGAPDASGVVAGDCAGAASDASDAVDWSSDEVPEVSVPPVAPCCGGSSALAVPTNADAQTKTPTRASVPIKTRGARRRRLRGSRLLRTTTHLPSTPLSPHDGLFLPDGSIAPHARDHHCNRRAAPKGGRSSCRRATASASAVPPARIELAHVV
jgi:hypothetical protein